MDDARNVRARLIRRAEIEDAGGGTSDLQMEDVGALLRAAADEIDRLRATLTVAANRLDWCIGIIPIDAAASGWPDEARAALNPTGGHDDR